MTTLNQKHQILESLDALDQNQTEKVLSYINGLMSVSREDAHYQKLKREAIQEIARPTTPMFPAHSGESGELRHLALGNGGRFGWIRLCRPREFPASR